MFKRLFLTAAVVALALSFAAGSQALAANPQKFKKQTFKKKPVKAVVVKIAQGKNKNIIVPRRTPKSHARLMTIPRKKGQRSYVVKHVSVKAGIMLAKEPRKRYKKRIKGKKYRRGTRFARRYLVKVGSNAKPGTYRLQYQIYDKKRKKKRWINYSANKLRVVVLKNRSARTTGASQNQSSGSSSSSSSSQSSSSTQSSTSTGSSGSPARPPMFVPFPTGKHTLTAGDPTKTISVSVKRMPNYSKLRSVKIVSADINQNKTGVGQSISNTGAEIVGGECKSGQSYCKVELTAELGAPTGSYRLRFKYDENTNIPDLMLTHLEVVIKEKVTSETSTSTASEASTSTASEASTSTLTALLPVYRGEVGIRVMKGSENGPVKYVSIVSSTGVEVPYTRVVKRCKSGTCIFIATAGNSAQKGTFNIRLGYLGGKHTLRKYVGVVIKDR